MNEKLPYTLAPSATPLQRLPAFFIAACLIAAIVFFCVSPSMADPDIGWHLRDAQLQLSSHAFLTHDLFSYTAFGSSWMDHEWLAELPFYAGFHLAGPTGLYIVTLLTLESIFLGLFFLSYSQSGTVPSALMATVLAIFLSTISFAPRTLLFGWLLLVVELLILSQSQRRPRLLWALPPLFALWVNTHGSWLIGIILFALFIAASSFTLSWGCIENTAASAQHLKRLVLCWLAAVALLFVNPYGWRLVFYPFDLAFRQKLNVANVDEWKSLDFHTPRGRVMLLCLALLFFFQLLRSRKWTLFELALIAVGLYSGFNYARFLFLAAILIAPILAKSFTSTSLQPRHGLSPVIAAAALFLIACCVVGRVRNQRQFTTTAATRFPDKALPFLENFQPQGNLFNEYTWGGFLIWHTRQIPVFLDSRVDIFEYNGTFADYLDIVHLKDPLPLLAKHNIRYVLFARDTPLVLLLKTTHDWRIVYEDETTTLLERTAPLPASPH